MSDQDLDQQPKSNFGDTAFKIVCLVLVVAVIVFFGWRHSNANTTDQPTPAAETAPEAPVHSVEPQSATPQKWTAFNNTSTEMTGDVTFSSTSLTLLKHDYPLALTHAFSHAEMIAAANLFSVSAPPGSAAAIYKLDIPTKAKLLNKDPMCPTDDAQWLITLTTIDPQYSAEDLYLGFFSGSTPPDLNAATISHSPASCGTFAYNRAVPSKAP